MTLLVGLRVGVNVVDVDEIKETDNQLVVEDEGEGVGQEVGVLVDEIVCVILAIIFIPPGNNLPGVRPF